MLGSIYGSRPVGGGGGGRRGRGGTFYPCAEKRKQSGFNLVSGGRQSGVLAVAGREMARPSSPQGHHGVEAKFGHYITVRYFFFPRRVLDMMVRLPTPASARASVLWITG